MFSQLLQKCEQVFKLADSSIKSNKKVLQQTRSMFPRQQYVKVDPTKNTLGATSFPKADRFKIIQKQEFKLADVSFSQSQINQNNIQNLKQTFTFTKSQRFLEDKNKSKTGETISILYPNFQVVKKNTKNGPVLRAPFQKDLSKSNISQQTATSLTQLGPGAYFIQQQKPKKSLRFSKQKRFPKQSKTYQDNPLFICQNQTKKRIPSSAILKKKIKKNQKLISLQQQQQMRQRLKLIYWKTIPLQLDRLLKTNHTTIIKNNYFDLKKLTGKAKKCAMLMILDRFNYLRGGYQNQIHKPLDAPTTALYRKSTPKPFKFAQMQPGPDYYYPKDDLVKEGKIGFTFGKAGQQAEVPVYDDRNYQINQQNFMKGGNIIIFPIHQQHKLTVEQIQSLNIGPGYYDSLFNQVQKRSDIGVLKYVQVTQKNSRQNNCIQIKQVNDGIYFPSYSGIDPNIPTTIYSQPSNIHPIHIPQKQLFPQHWVFYDGDLNKVRAQIAKNVILAKNMDFSQYKTYQKRFQAFKDYLKAREPIPQQGQYQIRFDQVDKHTQGFQMGKMVEKTLIQPITKQQGHVDGDNLILNPKNFQDHLPNIPFKTMVGRNDLQEDSSTFDEPRQGDRLILQPKKLQKKLPDIKFQKMNGRSDPSQQMDPQMAPQGNVLILNPKPIQKHIGVIDFSKKPLKHDPQINEIHDDVEQLVINPKVENKIKGFVQMSRMSSVKLVPILRKVKESSIKKNQKSNQYTSKKSIEQNQSQND